MFFMICFYDWVYGAVLIVLCLYTWLVLTCTFATLGLKSHFLPSCLALTLCQHPQSPSPSQFIFVSMAEAGPQSGSSSAQAEPGPSSDTASTSSSKKQAAAAPPQFEVLPCGSRRLLQPTSIDHAPPYVQMPYIKTGYRFDYG